MIKLREGFRVRKLGVVSAKDAASAVSLRLTKAESEAMENAKWELRASKSDILHSALVFVGVLPEPEDGEEESTRQEEESEVVG